jgi:hypothetical protein
MVVNSPCSCKLVISSRIQVVFELAMQNLLERRILKSIVMVF